jgi:hypothetical protein
MNPSAGGTRHRLVGLPPDEIIGNALAGREGDNPQISAPKLTGSERQPRSARRGAQVLPKFGRECFRPSSDRSDGHRDGISFALFLGTDVPGMPSCTPKNRIAFASSDTREIRVSYGSGRSIANLKSGQTI